MRLTLRSAALAATVFGSLAAAGAQDSTVTFQGATQNADGVISFPLIPHHVHRERMRGEQGTDMIPARRKLSGRRQLDGSSAVQVGALYQGYGTHYADLWVGTPPQRQTVIVDTGSGATAFPCSGCSDCGGQTDAMFHTDLYFVEDASSTFSKLKCSECDRGTCGSANGMKNVCHLGMSYQEGSSWSAYEGRDVAYTGGPHDTNLAREEAGTEPGDDPLYASAFSFELIFGCQVLLKGLFRTQLADGIMGMDNGDSSFWKQMFDANRIREKQFSLCFSRQDHASRDGTEAGAMTLGGVDTRLHRSPMLVVNNLRSDGFYAISIRKMYLREGGGRSATPDPGSKQIAHYLAITETELNRGGVILDSGTTDTYLHRAIGPAFRQVWKEIVGTPYNNDKVSLTLEQVASLPTVLIQLKSEKGMNAGVGGPDEGVTGLAGSLDPDYPHDVVLAIPASHYLEHDHESGQYTARVYVSEGGGSVLGANTMMGHDVLFDVKGGRIGIAESDCDYTGFVKDGGGSFTLVGGSSTKYRYGFNNVDGATCSGIKCQALVVIGLLGVALVVGVMSWKRFDSTRRMPVATEDFEEVEIADPSIPDGFRDHVIVDSDDEDEETTEPRIV